MTRDELATIRLFLEYRKNISLGNAAAVGWKISAERKFSDVSKVHIIALQMRCHTPLQLFRTLETNHLNKVVFLKTNCFLNGYKKRTFWTHFKKQFVFKNTTLLKQFVFRVLKSCNGVWYLIWSAMMWTFDALENFRSAEIFQPTRLRRIRHRFSDAVKSGWM